MPSPCCPACNSACFTVLEQISIDEQHQFYAPTEPRMKEILSDLIRQVAPSYRINLCSACGLEYADPMVAPSSDWYDLVYKLLPLYTPSRWEYDYVLKSADTQHSVGDIGCGGGDFLRKCQQQGLSCYGVDFSPGAIEQCHASHTRAALLDGSKDYLGSDGPKDILVAFQVLEHLDKPGQLFEWADAWANSTTVLWVAVPSNLRPTRIFHERDFLDQPPHHMTRWNKDALEKIGLRHRWKLVEHTYEPISVATYLWWTSTRSILYQRVLRDNSGSKWVERIVRYLLYPAVFGRWVFFREKMTGFSQIARYKRIG